jgi:hypothetical protein
VIQAPSAPPADAAIAFGAYHATGLRPASTESRITSQIQIADRVILRERKWVTLRERRRELVFDLDRHGDLFTVATIEVEEDLVPPDRLRL